MSRLVPISYDDWRTDPDCGLTNNQVREREAQHESDENHANCLDEMLHGIAQVAVEYLKHYDIGVSDKDIVDWLEGVRDDLMDNLLWQEWGNASDIVPHDRRAHCETALREARKWFEQKARK